MSDAVVPTSIPADGSLKVLLVPTLATPAEPTLAELTAPTVVDLSCYITADGWAPATDEQVSTDDRLCSRQSFERRGRFTDSLQVTYVYQGQEPAAVDNKAQATLRAGELAFIVARWGLDYELDIELGDIVDVYPIEAGVQQKQPPEANGRLKIMQKLFIRSSTQRDVVVVAS
jgi:hypothetical protein